MADKVYIGNFSKGLNNYYNAFNIDNDAFPYMVNGYVWRGRLKRKRGTGYVGRLEIQVESVSGTPEAWEQGPLTLSGGAGNLITDFSFPATYQVVPGSISVTVGANTYTEPSTPDGTLSGNPSGTGTINYATGAITITGGGSSDLTGTFSLYPILPVLGLRDLVTSTVSTSNIYPLLLAFDSDYSYQVNQTGTPIFFYNVTFYKDSENPFTWTGEDYQQFWTVNYQNALWATNNKPGFHFEDISAVTVGNPTQITTASPHNLITGDWVFFNEITGANAGLLNLQAFQITYVDATNFTVAVDTTAMTLNNDGIFQTLTYAQSGQDGIRWYDGDPTGGTGLPTSTGYGWVNFAPPLTSTTVSIDGKPTGLYYLVGALAIVPFKDRLLFFSPWIQTSTGTPIQLPDTVIWSWNGTPYYNALIPDDESYDATAYYVDETGKGGWLSAGISQPITTVSNNEDVLLVGFGGNGRKTRFVYSGNDLQPFLFFSINSELPSSATFSSVALDRGAIDIGQYGIAMTDQQSSQRIDLAIPDTIFNIQNSLNGTLTYGPQRINAIRDFLNEWIYFSYPPADSQWKFPTATLLFNYRENTWSMLYENFTSHGKFRYQQKNTWASIGQKFGTWNNWRQPWNYPGNISQYASIVAGNPQGFVLSLDEGTGEGFSGFISAIADDGNGFTQITSTNHCVESANPLTFMGDFLYFNDCIGSTFLNGQIGKVTKIIDANNFVVDIEYTSGTYLGLGQFSRLSQPLIQTKQFPFYWEIGRKTRLGVQKYLFNRTANSQVTINIYLSQDADNAWNSLVNNPDPNSLEYSQIVYTCPESTNLGLTPANTNLQMLVEPESGTTGSQQLWHRMNTSLIGDAVQLGLTLSEEQMKNYEYATSEIVLCGIQLDITPSQLLS